ncbi:MAG: hypothetical protein AAGK26_13470, partial [Pseudomonadota bacterium]
MIFSEICVELSGSKRKAVKKNVTSCGQISGQTHRSRSKMPNPITVSTAPQNTTATPETRHPDQPNTQPVVRFQDVLAAERTKDVLVDQPVSPQEAADEAPEQADLVPENVTVDTAQSRPVNSAEQEQTD